MSFHLHNAKEVVVSDRFIGNGREAFALCVRRTYHMFYGK